MSSLKERMKTLPRVVVDVNESFVIEFRDGDTIIQEVVGTVVEYGFDLTRSPFDVLALEFMTPDLPKRTIRMEHIVPKEDSHPMAGREAIIFSKYFKEQYVTNQGEKGDQWVVKLADGTTDTWPKNQTKIVNSVR